MQPASLPTRGQSTAGVWADALLANRPRQHAAITPERLMSSSGSHIGLRSDRRAATCGFRMIASPAVSWRSSFQSFANIHRTSLMRCELKRWKRRAASSPKPWSHRNPDASTHGCASEPGL